MLALKILWLFLITVLLESVVRAEEINTTILNYQLKAEDNPSSVRLYYSTRESDEPTTTSVTTAHEYVSSEENTPKYSDLPVEEDITQFEKTFLEHTTTDRTEKNVDILLLKNNTININVARENNNTNKNTTDVEIDGTQFGETFIDTIENNITKLDIAEHENNNTTENITNAEEEGIQLEETSINTIAKSIDEVFSNNLTKINIAEHENNNATENITYSEEAGTQFEGTFLEHTTTDRTDENVDIVSFTNNINITYIAEQENKIKAEENGTQLEETFTDATENSVDVLFKTDKTQINIVKGENNNTSENTTDANETQFERTFIEHTTTDRTEKNVDILLFKNNTINMNVAHENNNIIKNTTYAEVDGTQFGETFIDTIENNITKLDIAERENNNTTENITNAEEEGIQLEETSINTIAKSIDEVFSNNLTKINIAEHENNNATENITYSEEAGTQFEGTFLEHTTTDRTDENVDIVSFTNNINRTYIAEQENNNTKENKIKAEENGTQLEETFTDATENSFDVLFKTDKTQINIVKDENNNTSENTTDANETQFERTFIEHTTTDTIEESLDSIFKNSIIEPEVNNTMENTTSALDVTVEDIFNEPPPSMRVPQYYKIDSVGLSEVITRWLEEQHRQQVSAGSSSDLNTTESVSDLHKELPQQHVDVPSKDIGIEPTFMTPETYKKNITTESRMSFPDYSDLLNLDTTVNVNISKHKKIILNGDMSDTEGMGVSLNVTMEISVNNKQLHLTSDFSVDGGCDSPNVYLKFEWYDVENDCNVSVKFQIQCEDGYCFVDGLSIEIKNYLSDEMALVAERKHLQLFKILSESTLLEDSSSIVLNMGHGVVVTFYDVVFFARESFIKSLKLAAFYQFCTSSYFLKLIGGAVGVIVCGMIVLYLFKKFSKGKNHFKPETA